MNKLLLILLLLIIVPVASGIKQGDNVYLNDTVNISNILTDSYSQIAYYGTYQPDPTYIINISMKDRNNFLINSTIFRNRTGSWFKYNGNLPDKGVLLVFNVIGHDNMTVNKTIVNITVNTTIVPTTIVTTPTQEVIKVIETQYVDREVIKEVIKTVTITPDTGMVYQQQKRAQYDVVLEVVGVILGSLIFGYLVTVLIRGFKNV